MHKENTFFVTVVSVIAFRIPMSSTQEPRILGSSRVEHFVCIFCFRDLN